MKSINKFITESSRENLSSKPKNFVYKGVTGKIVYNAFIKGLKQECKKNSKMDWTWAAKEYDKNIKNLDEKNLNENSLYWLLQAAVLFDKDKKNLSREEEVKILYNLFEKYWNEELEGFRESHRDSGAGLSWTCHLYMFKFDENYTLSSNDGLGKLTLLNKYEVEQ